MGTGHIKLSHTQVGSSPLIDPEIFSWIDDIFVPHKSLTWCPVDSYTFLN